MKLKHVSGKIITVERGLGERIMKRNPGSYEEMKVESTKPAPKKKKSESKES